MGETAQVERPRHVIVGKTATRENAVERRHGGVGIALCERFSGAIEHAIGLSRRAASFASAVASLLFDLVT